MTEGAATIVRAIADAAAGHELDAELIESAFGEIMDGKATPAQIAALLVALRMKGETVAEIAAAARALRARASSAPLPVEGTVDTCGTGGSGVDTFNISTTAAFVVAGAGVPVAKHGNRRATSKCGSFDVLEALGVKIELPVAACAAILAEHGIATFFARTAHPAYRHVAPVRQEIGIRTLLNCLGPLLNPVGAKRQVVGVYDARLVEPLAAALGALGAERALVVHGSDGMDEITLTGTTAAALFDGHRVEPLEIDPRTLGLDLVTAEALVGGDASENARTLRAILDGEERGARRDIVCLNAAAALWVAEKAGDLGEGLSLAARSIDEGAARAKLDALVRASQEAGA